MQEAAFLSAPVPLRQGTWSTRVARMTLSPISVLIASAACVSVAAATGGGVRLPVLVMAAVIAGWSSAWSP